MSSGQDESNKEPNPPANTPVKSVPSTVVGEVPQALRAADAGAPQPVVVPPLATVPPLPVSAGPPTLVGTTSYQGQTNYGSTVQSAIPYHLPPSQPGGITEAPAWQGFTARGTGGPWFQQAIAFATVHWHRGTARDLRAIEATPPESSSLDVRGVRESVIRQFLIWRRSWLFLLMPLALFSAVIHIPGFFTEDYSAWNWFGVLVIVSTSLLQMFGYPAAALWAAWKWNDHPQSRWILLGGWVVSFLLPFIVALIPMHWFIQIQPGDAQTVAGQKLGAGMVGALIWLLTLSPAVLAMMPGIVRACVRIKSLLPESIVPGWFLVLTAPVFSLVLMILFIAVNQVAGNLLLIVGVLLIMGAPTVLLLRTQLFIKPVTEPRERKQIELLQVLYSVVLVVGVLLLLVYLYTLQILGHPVVGDTSEQAANPAMISGGRLLWEAAKFVISYAAKSMFVTAVAIDLFMLINLSIWRNMKTFETTPNAAAYDRMMEGFEAVAENRRPVNTGFDVVMK